MLTRTQLREYEIQRLDLQIALEVRLLAKANDDTKRLEASLKDLHARRASIKANEAAVDLNEIPDLDRYEHADVLFWATLQRKPLRAALRQLFEDSAPDPFEREVIWSLVSAAVPGAKEATLYSTLSRLVAEGLVEKTIDGYCGIPKK